MKEEAIILIVALVVGALAGWSITDGYHERKTEKLADKIAMLEAANAGFKNTVSNQNTAIASLTEYADKKAAEYAELLKKPEQIKYIKLKSNDCKDVRDVLNDIRADGF